MQREIRDNGVRVYNVEQRFIQVEARVNQLEDITRSRGQKKNAQLENLEQIREAVGRLRGEVEVLSHASGQGAKDLSVTLDDARFRVLWLEERADQLERSLGLSTPEPPPMPEPVVASGPEAGNGGAAASSWGGVDGGESTDGALSEQTEPTVEAKAVVVPDPVTTPVLDPVKLLEKAKAQLKAGNHVGAETLLGRFLETHPNHSRADEATYRRAEAAKVAENYEKAVLRYQEVIDQFKGSTFAPWAMLRQGECFDAQGQKDNAKVFFGEVIRIYPKSRAARAARKQLGK
jgi:tol-pal system protein YbgF